MASSGVSTSTQTTDSANKTKKFFDSYFKKDIYYSAEEVDAAVGHFLARGFDKIAATNTAVVLLQQAQQEDVPVFKIIDTLRGLDDVQLSNVVAQILNINREKTSTLGFKINNVTTKLEQRNIVV
jgi:hypothetical protein